MLNNIIDRLNQRIAVGNIFDKIYGLSELVESDSGKKWATYIGNGQLQHVTGFDAQQGTLFWGKRGRFNINRVDSFRTAGCQVAYDTRMLLTAYAVVRKSHLPCDSSDASDWVASRIYKLISGYDPQFKTALKVVAYEVIPSGYTSDIRSLPDNFEYAKVAVDIDVSVITQSSDACYDICETGDIPLPDFEPCTPCLTDVAVDGVTITGNGTPNDPLVALGGGGGGSLRIQDEGSTVTNTATTLNFTGDGVTASLTSPGVVEVNVPGGSGGVESVTGNLVDNTDPLNPIVNAAVSSDAGNDLTLGSDGLLYYQDSGSGGTVTSVSASVPSPTNPAFSVNVPNPNTTPSVDITANGNTSQLVLGDGSLASINQVVVAASVYQEDTYISGSQQTSVEYVASVGKVYVTNQTSGNVTIYDANDGDLLATISGITNALKAKYISSINEVWVTSSTATTIWRIDASANTLLGTITTGVTANGWNILEYSASKVFITCFNISGSIMVVNPSTLSVTTTITTNVPGFTLGMALNTNSSSLQFDKIVVCGAGGVAILDPNTNTITTTVVNPGSAFNVGRYIQYSAADDKYYAASQANGRIVCLSIDTATTFTATFIPNNLFLMDCAVDDANDLLFTFPMEGGGLESILVKVYQKSTLTPIVAFKTSCFGGAGSQSGFHAIDLLNKRLFVVGRNNQPNGAVSVVRYL